MFRVFGEVAEGIAKMATTQNEKVRVLQRKLYIASKQQEDYRFIDGPEGSVNIAASV